MREIGSEFWSVEIATQPCQIFDNNIQWYISGRSALQAIIKDLRWAKTVSMPAWCCDSMVKPFVDAGMKIKFYPVYPDHGLKQEIDVDADVLFLMDYFGYTEERVNDHPCIIRDVTHSFFSRNYDDADYYFGSLRKWCGICTGGFAWSKKKNRLYEGIKNGFNYVSLRSEAMDLKSSYINKKTSISGELVTDKHFLSIYEKAEQELDNIGIVAAPERDIELARMLDVDYIVSRRKENGRALMKAFPDMIVFPDLGEHDCPMFVPILVPNGKRDALRRYLIERDIYCPVHWPVSSYHEADSKSAVLYNDCLSLVCDQRYKQEDINRIINTIYEFMEA